MRQCASPECSVSFQPKVHNQIYHSLQCKRDTENVNRRRSLTNDVVKAVAPIYGFEDAPEVDERIDFLEKEVRRLTNLYNKYKNTHASIVYGINKAIADNLSEIDIPRNVPEPQRHSEEDLMEEEVIVPKLADLQLGKVTPNYNSEVCEERMERYASKVIEIADMHRGRTVIRNCHVRILGDIVEGENIFSTQAHVLDSSLYEQVAKNGPRILGNFLRTMLVNFDHVHVTAVIGNHGALHNRGGGAYNPETNMDRMLYKILEHIFTDEPRITFNIPDGYGESTFWAIDKIGGHSTLLIHGDQLPNPMSQHAYYKKILAWKTSGIPEDFTDVDMGHYHQSTKFTIGQTTVRISGTPESYNTFAQERLGVMGRPSQQVMFVDPNRGVTSEYDIFLD